jgi:hypothetical protein
VLPALLAAGLALAPPGARAEDATPCPAAAARASAERPAERGIGAVLLDKVVKALTRSTHYPLHVTWDRATPAR